MFELANEAVEKVHSCTHPAVNQTEFKRANIVMTYASATASWKSFSWTRTIRTPSFLSVTAFSTLRP